MKSEFVRKIKVWTKKFLFKINPVYRIETFSLRKKGKLTNLKSIAPLFKGKDLFVLGTGGSVANLKNVDRLKDCNVMTVTTAPLFLYREYGFVPNVWLIHNPDSIEMFFEMLKNEKLDFSNTFILVPANNSNSKVYFDSAIIRKLRKQFPEATYVLYKERLKTRDAETDDIESLCLKEGVEPIQRLKGGTLENLFLPFSAYLGIKKVYFSGIDHMDTGHFWDRDREYQLKDGTPAKFADAVTILQHSEIAQEIVKKTGMDVYRLEKEETVLKNYPLIDFDNVLANSSTRIIPDLLKNA